MNLLIVRTTFIILSTVVVGCATQTVEQTPEPKKQEVVVETKPVVSVVTPPPVIVEKQRPIVEKVVKVVPKPPVHVSTVYYDFDSSELSEDAKAIIATHTQFLLNHPEFSVTLEGHADARGDDRYNELLGRQRAQAIKEILLSENVNENQINLVSYGERKPAVEGDGFSAWQSNRRAIFVYSETKTNQNVNVKSGDSASQKLMVLGE